MEDSILDYFEDYINELDIPERAREELEDDILEVVKDYAEQMTEDIKDIIERYRYEFSREHIQDELDDMRTQEYLEG